MVTKCPKCGYPQYCGCWGCRDKIPTGYNSQIVTDEGYTCSNCGFEASYDQWEQIDHEQIYIERQLKAYSKKEER